MNSVLHQAVQEAISVLSKKNTFKNESGDYELRTLLPVASWKSHSNKPGKQSSLVIGQDSCGNFFLCNADGSVWFWDHETDEETFLATTVENFLNALVEPPPVLLMPGQVKKVWIDPDFLAEQQKKGNA